MTTRAVPAALSFGQQFLFQETRAKSQDLSRLNKKRARFKKAPAPINLKHVALAGLAVGFAGAIAVQCLWPSAFSQIRHKESLAQPKSAQPAPLVVVAHNR